ncbi:MAG: TolC family protein, partial [Desulfobulbaceae bacterium]|nr:TolC family protein [Desulfobulbaceae bacterium]
MKLNLFWVPVTVALFTAGCATRHVSTAPDIAESDSPRQFFEMKGKGEGSTSPFASAPESEQTVPDQLTMAAALALALAKNPSLTGFSAEIRAREAAALQAEVLPNPELGVEVDNFGGKDSLQGFDTAETTISFSQLVELGGKRENRRMVAGLEKTLAEWDYRSRKLDVLAATAKAFVEVLIAQEEVATNDELLKLAEQTAAAVGEKVAAGKVSPVEELRARIELAAARTEAAKAGRELKAAGRRLAGFWGGDRAGFARAIGQLGEIPALPEEESLKRFLSANPDLARWQAEIERSEAALALARSEAVPDLTLSAGFRNFQESDDNAFVAGVSLPIPFFNRNQGGVSEARARLDKARAEEKSDRVARLTDLSSAWQQLAAAHGEA